MFRNPRKQTVVASAQSGIEGGIEGQIESGIARKVPSDPELRSLIQTMQQMLVEARKENWQALDQLDQQRRALLQFNHTTPDPDTPQKRSATSAELIRTIFQLDESLMDTVLRIKKRRDEELQLHSKQSRAVKSYARASLLT